MKKANKLMAWVILMAFMVMQIPYIGVNAASQLQKDPFARMHDVKARKIREQVSSKSKNLSKEQSEIVAQNEKDKVEMKEMMQKRLDEQGMSSRYIVKYKNNGDVEFKNKIKKSLKKTKTIGKKNVTSQKREMIELQEKVNPKDFADELKKQGLGELIEYIQPDYEIGLSSNTTDTIVLSVSDQSTSAPTTIITVSPQPIEATSTPVQTTATPVVTSTPSVQETTVPMSSATPTALQATTVPTLDSGIINPNQTMNINNSNDVIVAVIDSGIDITHQDLANNIYVNKTEINNNTDEDKNGYMDDINGWNFCDDNNVVYDQNSPLDATHGTHVAGIIATNGINGVASNVKIMPLKVFKNGVAYTSDIIEAIEYAVNNGAKIINCSFGSAEQNDALGETISNSGAMFVCAAGNGREDLDVNPVYPAAYNYDNVISVTSVNADDGLSFFSNYSQNVVSIAALGRDVKSTLPQNKYGNQTGTSMSAAYVSGCAAAVLSKNQNMLTIDLKMRLIQTADKLSNLVDKVIDGRRINLNNALNNIVIDSVKTVNPKQDFDANGYAKTPEESFKLFSSLKTIEVSMSSSHALALKEDGSVWGWGDCSWGAIGLDISNNNIMYAGEPVRILGLDNVKSISAGNHFSLAIKNDGTVWAWGANNYGQIANSYPYPYTYIPRQVYYLPISITKVFAEADNCFVLNGNGDVYSWGNNQRGALGRATSYFYTSQPYYVTGNVNKIVVGTNGYTMYLKNDGTVYSSGYSVGGSLGSLNAMQNPSVTQIQGFSNVKDIAVGDEHALVLDNNGVLKAFGSNAYGQLGNGTTVSVTQDNPVTVVIPNVKRIFAGYNNSFAIDSSSNSDSYGDMFSWGRKDSSIITAIGRTGDNTLPVKIGFDSGISLNDKFSMIDCSRLSAIALDSNYDIWTWGANSTGLLGTYHPGAELYEDYLDSMPTKISHTSYDAVDKPADIVTTYSTGELPTSWIYSGGSTSTPATGSDGITLSGSEKISTSLSGVTSAIVVEWDMAIISPQDIGTVLGFTVGGDAGLGNTIGLRTSHTGQESLTSVKGSTIDYMNSSILEGGTGNIFGGMSGSTTTYLNKWCHGMALINCSPTYNEIVYLTDYSGNTLQTNWGKTGNTYHANKALNYIVFPANNGTVKYKNIKIYIPEANYIQINELNVNEIKAPGTNMPDAAVELSCSNVKHYDLQQFPNQQNKDYRIDLSGTKGTIRYELLDPTTNTPVSMPAGLRIDMSGTTGTLVVGGGFPGGTYSYKVRAVSLTPDNNMNFNSSNIVGPITIKKIQSVTGVTIPNITPVLIPTDTYSVDLKPTVSYAYEDLSKNSTLSWEFFSDSVATTPIAQPVGITIDANNKLNITGQATESTFYIRAKVNGVTIYSNIIKVELYKNQKAVSIPTVYVQNSMAIPTTGTNTFVLSNANAVVKDQGNFIINNAPIYWTICDATGNTAIVQGVAIDSNTLSIDNSATAQTIYIKASSTVNDATATAIRPINISNNIILADNFTGVSPICDWSTQAPVGSTATITDDPDGTHGKVLKLIGSKNTSTNFNQGYVMLPNRLYNDREYTLKFSYKHTISTTANPRQMFSLQNADGSVTYFNIWVHNYLLYINSSSNLIMSSKAFMVSGNWYDFVFHVDPVNNKLKFEITGVLSGTDAQWSKKLVTITETSNPQGKVINTLARGTGTGTIANYADRISIGNSTQAGPTATKPLYLANIELTSSTPIMTSTSILTLNESQNGKYNVVIKGNNLTNVLGKVFQVQYDANVLKVKDLCSITNKINNELGEVQDSNVYILYNSPGLIEFKVNNIMVPSGYLWSGVLNSIQFESDEYKSGPIEIKVRTNP